MKKSLLFLAMLTSCGPKPLESILPQRNIENRFLADFNDFIAISKEYGYNPSLNDIRYMNTKDSILDQGVVGMCYSDISLTREYYAPEHKEDEYRYNQIEIVSESVLSDLKIDLKEVVYHELLHCIFKIGHNEENRDDIMYPYVGQSKISPDQRLRNNFQEKKDREEKGLE